jgi:hypothetical protein
MSLRRGLRTLTGSKFQKSCGLKEFGSGGDVRCCLAGCFHMLDCSDTKSGLTCGVLWHVGLL